MAENLSFKTALNKAMSRCSVREYCINEIRDKIITWGIDNNDAEKIISVLLKENFLNESRFATAFAKDKFNYNRWGKIKISLHLRQKKISSENINNALKSIDYELYVKVLKDLIVSHRRTIKAKNQYDLKAKLMRYGLSKGFESSLLYALLGEAEE